MVLIFIIFVKMKGMIVVDSNRRFQSQISDLYAEVYSSGVSAQKIDPNQLSALLNLSYEKGWVIVDAEDEKLRAALLCFPLLYDQSFPDNQIESIDLSNSIYVAEVMVADLHRKKGIAGDLLAKFLDLSVHDYRKAVIRVWEKNEIALHLYHKIGFRTLCTIEQEKMNMDGTKFKMQKRYLCKTL